MDKKTALPEKSNKRLQQCLYFRSAGRTLLTRTEEKSSRRHNKRLQNLLLAAWLEPSVGGRPLQKKKKGGKVTKKKKKMRPASWLSEGQKNLKDGVFLAIAIRG